MTIPVAKNRNNYLSVPPPSCWTEQSGSARAAWAGQLALRHKENQLQPNMIPSINWAIKNKTKTSKNTTTTPNIDRCWILFHP